VPLANSIVGRVLFVIVVLTAVLVFVCGGGMLWTNWKAIQTRKPGVSFFRAMNWHNLLAKNELYEPERDHWVAAYVRWFLGMIACFIVIAACSLGYEFFSGRALEW
jgi:hypothetical protein